MATLTKDAVRIVLGPIDDTLMPTFQRSARPERELIEARGWSGANEALHAELRRFPIGRVAALVELLDQYEAAPEDRR